MPDQFGFVLFAVGILIVVGILAFIVTRNSK
jgi:hypothetical protein